ncbi:MAG: hypothetical protein HZB27_01160 [Meiothermus silvanus]|nr:hypothetical protein [Allomeiothermus silvanus]
MYPNPEMAKKIARERVEAIQQEANQRRLLQEAGLELARPFRHRLAFWLAQLAQRLDAEVILKLKIPSS